jgi:hypothetical protein
VINLEHAVVPFAGLVVGDDADQFTFLSAFNALNDSERQQFQKKLKQLNRNLSNLISAGIKVLVVSDWSRALASTAAFTLELNFNYLVGRETRPTKIHDKLEKLSIEGNAIGDVNVEVFGTPNKSEFIYVSRHLDKDLDSGANSSTWVCSSCREEYDSIGLDPWGAYCSECNGCPLTLIHESVAEGGLDSLLWSGLIGHISDVSTRDVGHSVEDSCLHSHFRIRRLNKQRNTLSHVPGSGGPSWIESGYEWSTSRIYQQPVLPDSIRVFNPFSLGKWVDEPFLNPDFITQFEYSTDISLRNELFEMLRNIFPCEETSNRYHIQPGYPRYFSLLPFDDLMAKKLLVSMKNWTKSNRAGSDVKLLHVEFIALVMSATLVLVEGRYSIVPAPPSKFSRDKPGQVSVLLARRIAELLSAPFLNILLKDDEGGVVSTLEAAFGQKVVVIDDQITYGYTIEICLQALTEHGYEVSQVTTWSYSAAKPIISSAGF